MNHFFKSLLFFFVAIPWAQSQTTNNLVFYVNFDVNDGSVVYDVSGSSFTGQVHGATYVGSGVCGGAYQFDGTNYIDFGDVLGLDGSTYTTLTSSAWIKGPKFTSGPAGFVVGRNQSYAPATGWGTRIEYYERGFVDLIGNYPQRAVSGHAVTNAVMNGQWHNIVGVYEVRTNSLHTKYYLDGVLLESSTWNGTHATCDTFAGLWIGAREPLAEGFVGLIDEVRVYDRELTPAEITNLFALGSECAVDGGAITAQIEPPGAIAAGALWSVTNGPDTGWKSSGYHLGTIPTGEYTVVWNDVSGWTKPDAQNVIINPGDDLVVTGRYTSTALTTNGLVLHYSFDADDGSVVNDESGSGFQGQVNGATHVDLGTCGGAYQFDGSGYINVGDVLGLDGVAYTTLTSSVWIKGPKLTEHSAGAIIGRNLNGSPYTGWGTRIEYFDRGFVDLIGSFPERAVSGHTVTNAAMNDQWHNIIGVYEVKPNSLHTKYYLDGVLLEQATWSGPHASCDTSAQLWIGAREPFGEGFVGLIDEVRVYDRELNQSEITDLYALGGGCPESGASITVQIEPPGAVVAGAMWSVTNGPDSGWKSSGYHLGSLPTGEYTVAWNDVSGWIKPDPQNVVLDEGSTLVITGRYTSTAQTTNGLVLHFTFDSDDGAVVNDDSGSGFQGQVNGATHVDLGSCGGAYQFDGTDYINVGDVLGLDGLAYTTLTSSAWVKGPKLTDHSAGAIIGRNLNGWPSTGWGTRIEYFERGFVDLIGIYPERAVSGHAVTNAVMDDQWHNIISVYEVKPNSLHTKYYLDGVLMEDATWTGPHASCDTSAQLWIGAREPFGEGFVGLIDEVRVYDRELSPSEITDLYALGGGCPETGASITVQIEPPGAVIAGALWKLTSGPDTGWKSSGNKLGYLPTGEYSVVWNDLNGWVTPDPQNVVVDEGSALVVTGRYTSTRQTTNGLVLHFTFDPDDGAVVNDVSGSGFHGQVNGATHVDLGPCGGAYQFDGAAYINVGDVLGLDGLTYTTLTSSAWVKGPKFTGHTAGAVMGRNLNGWPYTGWGTRVEYYDRGFIDLIGNYPQRAVSGHAVTNAVMDDQWHNIVGVYEVKPTSLHTKYYLDGVLLEDATWLGTHATCDTGAGLWIGAREPFGEGFVGLIDEVRVYDRELSPAEIADLYVLGGGCNSEGASITVNIQPEGANVAGAMWTLVPAPDKWMPSGASVNNLPAGEYIVCFNTIPGWSTPSCVSTTLSSGESCVITAIYAIKNADMYPPVIVDIHPPNGSVAMLHSMALNIVATDNVGVAYVRVNGVNAEKQNDSHYHFLLDNVRGSYNMALVEVSDFAGNTTNVILNYAQSADLKLTAMWDGYWRVRNPNETNIDFTWEVVGLTETGSGTVTSNRDAFFSTSTGSKTVQLFVDGLMVDSKHSSEAPAPDNDDARWIDSDGDGVANYFESISGTDEGDASDVFEVISRISGGASPTSIKPLNSTIVGGHGNQYVYEWYAYVGVRYTFQYSTDLRSWINALDYIDVAGQNDWVSYTNALTGPTMYYRVLAH